MLKGKKTWLRGLIVCVYAFQLFSFAIGIFIHRITTVTAIILFLGLFVLSFVKISGGLFSNWHAYTAFVKVNGYCVSTLLQE